MMKTNKTMEITTMTLLEIYRSRKDALAQRIKESKSLYESSGVISEALETIKYQYLSENENQPVKEELEELIKMAKSSLPMIESVNKSKLWDNHENAAPKKKNPLPGLILLIIGVALVFGSIWYYMFLRNIKFVTMQPYFMAMAFGCFLILLAGFALFFRKKPKNKAVVEIMVDADDLVKRFEEVVKEMDSILDNEKTKASRVKDLVDNSINSDEATLFAYLMEAKYSKQPDFAMEQLEEVEHYLTKMDVLIVNYSQGNEKYFNFLEGEEERTARPALLRSGEVIAKGLVYVKDLKKIDL